MSYILDALRRAEAERERGAVPSLQSQQHTIADDDAGQSARPRALVWAVVALVVALVAALGWSLFARAPAPTAPRAVVEGAVAPAAPAPASPAVLLPTSPSPPAQTTATPVPAPLPRAAEAARPAAATALVAPRSPVRAEGKRAARRDDEVAGRGDARGEPATARASGDARIYKQSELPDDVRRDLPRLAIGGASYSGDAASRMVMINGQIFHEGDQLAPNLVLERIKLKSAVLSYKGYRYEVTF